MIPNRFARLRAEARRMPPSLFERMRAGDAAAANDWLAAHRDLLLRAAKRAGVAPGHAADASDVVQNASLALWQWVAQPPEKKAAVATEADLLRWLGKVVRNRAVDEVRGKAKKLHQVPRPDGAADPLAQLAGVHSTCSASDQREERRRCIEGRKAAMTAGQLRVVVLHEFNGLPLKTIAEVVGLSPVETAAEFYRGVAVVRAALDALADRHLAAADARMRQVQAALAGLPERQRLAVELGHLEKPTFALLEIAAVLGCGDGDKGADAAAAVVHRGIKKLRAVLKPPSGA